MRIGIYSLGGSVTRSVVSAVFIVEIEVDEWPEDEEAFAELYGGDFLQSVNEDYE